MSEQETGPTTDVIGETLVEAEFDVKIAAHARWFGSLILLGTVVGVVLIPFWVLLSRWYYAEYLRRISARLTSHALVIKKGVFFRKEATIPLDRITDVRLHDGPLMRHFGLRGLKVETAGQAGQAAGSEGDLVGVVDAADLRDAILRQRQQVLDAQPRGPAGPVPEGETALLREIRDILARIEQQATSGDA